MITKNEILEFIKEEQTQLQNEIDAYKRLTIEEKVKARKAIVGAIYDESYLESFSEYGLFRFLVNTNLSSLGVGDSILVNNMDATLWDFDNEGNLIVGFYGRAGIPFGCFQEGAEIIIEKNYGNFLAPIFRRFINDLPYEDDDFWAESIIPSHKEVYFDGNIDKWEEIIKKLEADLEIQLLDIQREAIAKAMAAKDYYMLQGPPGTGKSYVIAIIAIALAFYYKQRVCIVGPNYMAINNALVKICQIYPDCIPSVAKVGYPYQTVGLTFVSGEEIITIQNFQSLNVTKCNELQGIILGMTPYTFYSSRAEGIKFDTVIIDESGQMSSPVAMMAAKNCQKVIFCGDHKQLSPIIKAEDISDSLKRSVFDYMLKENNYTMLNLSFRMNGPICEVVSDLFYEGRLNSSAPEKRLQVNTGNEYISGKYSIVSKKILGDGKQSSAKEAEEIDTIIRSYSSVGIKANTIGVLAPFRAQCNEIRRKIYHDSEIPDEYMKNIVIDTIDKLQGQEREIIILSLTAGNIDYINEFSEFLYNPNKLNVAISRAKTKLFILGNFDIIRTMKGYEGSYIQKLLTHPNVKEFK